MRAEETLRFLPLSDGKQPLFMWSMIPFLKIFSDPLFAGRFLSVVCGVLSMLGILIFSFLIFKNLKISIFALFLYAISPFNVFFERLSLVDSMLSMFGLWSFIFAFLALKKRRMDFAIFSGFCLGGALITKSPALFFVLLLPLILLLLDWEKSLKKKLSSLKVYFSLFAIIYIIAYAIYNILRLGPNFHLLASRNLDYVFPISHVLESPFNPFLGHLKDVFVWFLYFSSPFMLILFLIGIWEGFVAFRKQTVFLLVVFVIPILIQSEYAKVFTARYILFVLPYFILVSSLSILAIKKLKFLFLGLFSGFILFSLFQVITFAFVRESSLLPENERSGYLEEWTAGYGIKEVSSYLIDFYKKNQEKEIVVGTEGFFGTLPDGLQIYLNSYPNIKVLGLGLNFREIPKPLLDSSKNGTPTFFVFNDSRGDISNYSNASIIASYPKAKKDNGSFESLLFYRITP